MGIHSFIEYLKYQWKAKGRHGTHSPFVYDFIEHVLLDKSVIKNECHLKCPELELKYENLICRIAAYYNHKDVFCLPSVSAQGTGADMLLINEEPGKWVALLNGHMHLLKSNSVVIISGIHKTHARTKAWRKLIAYPEARMDIDLYGIGLLFFKDEFKQRQHFVLKF